MFALCFLSSLFFVVSCQSLNKSKPEFQIAAALPKNSNMVPKEKEEPSEDEDSENEKNSEDDEGEATEEEDDDDEIASEADEDGDGDATGEDDDGDKEENEAENGKKEAPAAIMKAFKSDEFKTLFKAIKAGETITMDQVLDLATAPSIMEAVGAVMEAMGARGINPAELLGGASKAIGAINSLVSGKDGDSEEGGAKGALGGLSDALEGLAIGGADDDPNEEEGGEDEGYQGEGYEDGRDDAWNYLEPDLLGNKH